MKKEQRIKTAYGTIVATPLEPVPTEKKSKPLCPEMAQRKIRALKTLLREGDITESDFRRIKRGIIAQVVQ